MLFARLPVIVASLLAIAILSIISFQAYHFYQKHWSKDFQAPTAQATSFKKPAPVAKPTRNIASYKLFGDMNAKPKVIKPVTKDLPKTKLNLTLTGVMTSQIPEEASALIQTSNKETQYFKVNDEIPGGAILKQVFEDRVVVERNGQLENLIFVEKRAIGIETIVDYRDQEEQEMDAVKPVKNQTAKAQKTSVNNARTQGIKERLSKLRKKMLQNRQSQ